jgi:quinol monooxygenase YgiN
MKNRQLTLVAIVKAKEEKREFVKSEIIKLIDITRKEEGNISYDLHQGNDDQNLFVLYENWENREVWQKHMNNDHMLNYAKVTDGATVDWQLHELTKVD